MAKGLLEIFNKYLRYDPETGIFYWKVRRGGKAVKGSIAGSPNSEGYIHIGINGVLYKAHRIAWIIIYGYLEESSQIDHINRSRDDNRISNLRKVCNSKNQRNVGVRKDNKSGVPGVIWNKGYGKWVSRIHVNSKRIEIGRTTDKFEAICMRKSAEIRFNYHESHGRNLNV